MSNPYTIAIMQPYFMPYLGYFRLFCEADLFVVLDDVQFPRRGWVHRNQLLNDHGNAHWLTMPLKRQDYHTHICHLEFGHDKDKRWQTQLGKFPAISKNKTNAGQLTNFLEFIYAIESSPCDYIVKGLNHICQQLNIECDILYSSQLNIDPTLKNQQKIIATIKHFNAKRYVNAPGGKDLYNQSDFNSCGIELHFLPEYSGSYLSILQRILCEDTEALKYELSQNI